MKKTLTALLNNFFDFLSEDYAWAKKVLLVGILIFSTSALVLIYKFFKEDQQFHALIKIVTLTIKSTLLTWFLTSWNRYETARAQSQG